MSQRGRQPPGFSADGVSPGGGASQQGLGLGGFGASQAAPAFRLGSSPAPHGIAGPGPQPPLWSTSGQGAYSQQQPPGLPPFGAAQQRLHSGAQQHPGFPANGPFTALGSHPGTHADAPGSRPGESYGQSMRYGGGQQPIGGPVTPPVPPLQQGIIGELPTALRQAAATDNGSALLRLLQRNSGPTGGQQAQQPPMHAASQMPLPGSGYNTSQVAAMMSDLRVSGPPGQPLQQAYCHRMPPVTQPHHGGGSQLPPPPYGQPMQQAARPGGGMPQLPLFMQGPASTGPQSHISPQQMPPPLPPLGPQMIRQQQTIPPPMGMPIYGVPAMPGGAQQAPAVPLEDAIAQQKGKNPSRVNQREVREAALAARGAERAEDGNRGRRPMTPAPLKADATALSHQLADLVRTLQPSDADTARQMACFERLRVMLQREWPDAQLHMYGSCANGFGGPSSDIDTCLALRWADTQDRKRSIVQRIAELAAAAGAEYSDVLALTHARMPVAKLHDVATGVRADVCVNNFLAVYNTRMLRDYARLDIRMRQLGYCVKHWAKRRSVNEPYTGTLSSYCYILMCIHQLQTRKTPVLPCLQAAEHTFSADVEGIRIGYNDDMRCWAGYGEGNTESLAHLLHAFFDYWAWRHDYGGAVVCIRTGGTLPKRRKGWTTRVGTERHLICVEDPFETSHDLGRVVDKRSIGVLREEFERAERILRTDPNPLEALFEEYVQPANDRGTVKGVVARGQKEDVLDDVDDVEYHD